jgi:hypothetical protein
MDPRAVACFSRPVLDTSNNIRRFKVLLEQESLCAAVRPKNARSWKGHWGWQCQAGKHWRELRKICVLRRAIDVRHDRQEPLLKEWSQERAWREFALAS